jgi:hypothetical protein
MNCCDDNGVCTQNKDCAIRKRRELDVAYIRGKEDTDPYTDIISEFKTLIALLAVIAGLTMLAFAIWGRP